MKTWMLIFVLLIVAVCLYSSGLQRNGAIPTAVQTSSEAWSALLRTEAAGTQLPPQVTLPTTEVDAFPKLLVSFTMKRGVPYDRATLIMKKHEWQREHPQWVYVCEWEESNGLTVEFLPSVR